MLKRHVQEDKIRVIYDPIDDNVVSSNSKTSEKKYLGIRERFALFVGSLNKLKGANYVTDVAKLLPEYKFVVIGSGPLDESLKNVGLPNVSFVGQLPIKQVRRYFRAADVLLYPNMIHASYGRIAAESYANETPVVSFAIKGIDELVTKKTGIVCEIGNAKAMAQGIKKLLTDSKTNERMAREGRKIVITRHALIKIADQTAAVYRSFWG
jgi:glycosyltransferase involved in cell wall biosynthesis